MAYGSGSPVVRTGYETRACQEVQPQAVSRHVDRNWMDNVFQLSWVPWSPVHEVYLDTIKYI